MKFWSIDIKRVDHFALEVEAETPEAAMAMAMEMICDSDEPTMDFDSHSNGFEVTGCRG